MRPLLINMPAIMAVTPTSEPTERSMPPVRITKVMPMASKAFWATCFETISIFPALRNCGQRVMAK